MMAKIVEVSFDAVCDICNGQHRGYSTSAKALAVAKECESQVTEYKFAVGKVVSVSVPKYCASRSAVIIAHEKPEMYTHKPLYKVRYVGESDNMHNLSEDCIFSPR